MKNFLLRLSDTSGVLVWSHSPFFDWISFHQQRARGRDRDGYLVGFPQLLKEMTVLPSFPDPEGNFLEAKAALYF